MNNDVNQKIRAKKGRAPVSELHELEIYPKWEGNSECSVCVFRSEGIPGAVRTESSLVCSTSYVQNRHQGRGSTKL